MTSDVKIEIYVNEDGDMLIRVLSEIFDMSFEVDVPFETLLKAYEQMGFKLSREDTMMNGLSYEKFINLYGKMLDLSNIQYDSC